MRKTQILTVMAWAMLAGGLVAGPAEARPKVGDRLAAYTPAKNVNSQGRLKCETC